MIDEAIILSGLLPFARFGADHDAFHETVCRFVNKAALPRIDAWEEAETFPRALYHEAAGLGLLDIGSPEECDGTPGDLFLELTMVEELARVTGDDLPTSLFSYTIGAPPVVVGGSAELKARVLPAIPSGERVSALATTEPSGDSDAASFTTRAVRDDDHYVVPGSKIFITSGMRVDYITVTVRTGEAGAGGISMLLVEDDTSGLSRTPLKKMSWWCSDTAQLHLGNCHVPVSNLLSAEDRGFELVMHNFNHEHLVLAMQTYGLAHTYLIEAMEWAAQRETLGKHLVQHQMARQKLMAVTTRIEATRVLLEDLMRHMQAGDSPVTQPCMLKSFTTQGLQFYTDTAVQLLDGMDFVRGTKSERIYREAKIYMIGGGAEEVLSNLAVRQLSWT